MLLLFEIEPRFGSMRVAVLEPKRVPQGRELHVRDFHHNSKPGNSGESPLRSAL